MSKTNPHCFVPAKRPLSTADSTTDTCQICRGICGLHRVKLLLVLHPPVLTDADSLAVSPRDECCKPERAQNLREVLPTCSCLHLYFRWQQSLCSPSWFTSLWNLKGYYLAPRAVFPNVSFVSSLCFSSDNYYTTILLFSMNIIRHLGWQMIKSAMKKL